MAGNLMGSYADSKMAQGLFSGALARRIKPPTVTHALHPAITPTGIFREFHAAFTPTGRRIKEAFDRVVNLLMRHWGFFQNEADAPKTQIHVSTHPDVQKSSGLYYTALAPPLVGCGRPAHLC